MDARAQWPFVCMWDNHEFSWKGWQTQQNFDGHERPAQTRKAAAMQAWFEYQPARVVKRVNDGDRYKPPDVPNVALDKFDDYGLGLEAGNLAVIRSMKLFRTLRWGRNIELLLTDNRSFRSAPIMDRAEMEVFKPKGFPFVSSQYAVEVLDAGRAYNGGHAPDTIRFGDVDIPNPRKSAPPQSMLGSEQKKWFLQHLRNSTATWKLWGNSVAMMDWRLDFQNLAATGNLPKWPCTGYAQFADDDWSGYLTERAEILDFIRREGITCIATVAGDRHSFQAGVLSSSLPPKLFEPVAAEFVTGSISAPGLFEAAEFGLPREHPLREIYVRQSLPEKPAEPVINFSMMHGIKAGLLLAKGSGVQKALSARNPDVAPHLSFMDAGGHGYSVVRVSGDDLEVEFVCIPRPVERSNTPDGGILAYRVAHKVKAWKKGARPKLERTICEGKLPMVV